MVNGLLSPAGQMPVNTRVWGEFVAKDLFGPSKLGKYHNPSTLHESDDGYEFICASVRNNGINHAMPKVDGENLSLTPPNIIAWGKQSPFFTYHENPCVTSQGMYFIEINGLTRNQIHFVITILNKLTRGYNYTNCLIGKKFDELSIPLPLKPGTDEVNYTEDDIDWAYMESYIQELEESYIQELEESYIQELDAYLKETGLDDYTLTDDEREVLEREPVFKEFKVGELFDIVGRGTRLTKQNRIAGNVPLVTAGRENQGVAEYIQENKQLFRGPVFTIDMFGNVFVRDYDFYADDNIIVFGKEGLSINQFLYIASALDYLSGVYGYGNQFRLNSIGNTFIKLPVKQGTDEVNYTEDDIDWDYIEAYVRAMEKQVIADVVDYKNEMISTTKALVKK